MASSKSHQDRIVLVTGASRGIGFATALAFAEAGAHVIALARTVGGLEELDDRVAAVGGKCSLIPADLTDEEALSRLPDALAQRFGRIDAFIANAGVLGDLTPVTDITPKMWASAFAVNVTANQRLLAGLDPLLKQSEAGRVVGLTSSRAHKYVPFWSVYSATKAAFEALLKVYAEEVAHTNIRVNLVDPGPIATKMRAKAMPGEDQSTLPQPEELAPLILSLASAAEERQAETVRFKET